MSKSIRKAGQSYCSYLCYAISIEQEHLEHVIRHNNGQRMDDQLTEAWTQLVAAADAVSEYRSTYRQMLAKGLRWPHKPTPTGSDQS
ncbi:hypothetical protein [Rhodococcus opacus]|uniref:hypothetical protein n=1 Tax=Rhodococcus opacus TaxID=37919 RepID=UPI002235C499|nr:hypothetical protein [Rhodococcus opacus]UZG58231.1 hypothetical protein ONE62_13330 [Rhodococcus opacus]